MCQVSEIFVQLMNIYVRFPKLVKRHLEASVSKNNVIAVRIHNMCFFPILFLYLI